MRAYLPPFLTSLKEMAELLKAEAPEFDKQNDSIFDLTDQLFVPTATWGSAAGKNFKRPAGIRRH